MGKGRQGVQSRRGVTRVGGGKGWRNTQKKRRGRKSQRVSEKERRRNGKRRKMRETTMEKWKEKEDAGGGKDRREEGTWREGDTARKSRAWVPRYPLPHLALVQFSL